MRRCLPGFPVKEKLTYIDLFAGCGGLSLGLEKAGFSLELAVEKSDMAAETFFHNFIKRISDISEWKKFCSSETPIQKQAKEKLVVKELAEVLKCRELIRELRAKDIDLIAGGPPCQGFSMAGRRNPKDARNQLPWQFLELVEKIQPRAVLIENVAGMKQNFVKHDEDAPFEQLRIALSQTAPGYVVQPVLLNAMHFGVPQHRPRVMLLAIRQDIADLLGITATEETWKSDYDLKGHRMFAERPKLAPKVTHRENEILRVKDALWDLCNGGYATNPRSQKYSHKGGRFAKEAREARKWLHRHIILASTPGLKNHALRKHADITVQRFRLYQYLRDNGIPARVLNIPAKSSGSLASKMVLVKELLSGAKFPAKSPDKHLLARNAESLAKLIIELGTKKHSQRPLNWDEPAPTIVSLPDDFVHPSIPRTMTVRELARIQSFPDNFEFRAKETTGSLRRRFEVPQYTQVGNAVPPLLAYAVGKVLEKILSQYKEEFEAIHLKRAS
jgi:DNA (cytosine-5)-methyltransferase 1